MGRVKGNPTMTINGWKEREIRWVNRDIEMMFREKATTVHHEIYTGIGDQIWYKIHEMMTHVT